MEQFNLLLKYPPKNAWNAVLVQLCCWSFRRFCIERLNNKVDIWDNQLTLVSEYAPPQFKPYLEHWLAPEQVAHVANLTELDAFFRSLIVRLDESISEAEQDILATFFDEEMGARLESWLGAIYAPFSLFPSPTETDTEIDMTKLNAIIYLLQRQPSLNRTKRKTLRLRRALTPVRTQMRKTRHANVVK